MRFMFVLILVCIGVPFISGCERKAQERHYQEIVIESATSDIPVMGDDPHAGLGLNIPMMNQPTLQENFLAWNVPVGWEEVSGSGMRVASFKIVDNPDEIDVSIVSLGGIAGGLEANLARWATQINLKLKADADLPLLISNADTIDLMQGLQAKIFDFMTLQQGQALSTPSMIAAMIEMDDVTVFVKMTGTMEAVLKNKEAFKALTRSVRKK